MAMARSEIMRRIKSSGTGPETDLEWALRHAGLWPKAQDGVAAGDVVVHPDLVFPESRVAVFVHGCFWHGCRRHYRAPKTNVVFWRTKVTRNLLRDRRQARALRRLGWRPIVVWEHDVNRRLDAVVARVRRVVQERG